MRRIALSIAALAVLAFPATVGAAKTYTVKVGDDFFSPTKKTVKVRDIVKWVWVDASGQPGSTVNEHSIVETKDRFNSTSKTSGSYKFRFKKAGKYTIVCGEHPEDMIFRVTVKK